MIFRLTPSLNDGKNDPPPIEVRVPDNDADYDALFTRCIEEMHNDYGQPFGVGFTLKIERIA